MVVLFRGRSDALNTASLPLPISTPTSGMQQNRPARLVCVVTSLAAFLMGIGVGITLPFALARNQNDLFTETVRFPNSITPNTLISSSESTLSSNSLLENPLKALKETNVKNKEEKGYRQPLSLAEIQTNENQIILDSINSIDNSLLDENIFLGKSIESKIPTGFTDEEVDDWRKFTRTTAVIRLQEGCGRMQNRLITFSNGSQSCCRYRQNYDQIQGEIFSFYLSRLLGIHNVPPSTLGLVKASDWQWNTVGNQLALASWAEERPVVLTKYVENLESAFIPTSLRSSTRRRLHPIDVEIKDHNNDQSISEIAQWSDLIIFDYLTANLDRIVNNLYNMQWNPSMMEAPAHNLARYKESGLLVFLDNESGLLHGYRLLDKYEPFHFSLLESLCVFRKSTAKKITQLVHSGKIGEKLQKMFKKYEPEMTTYLPTIPEKSVRILNERLKKVYKQIKKCQNMFFT